LPGGASCWSRPERGQAAKTLAHELGHSLLHGDGATERALAELEAESVAFIICEAVGIAADEYSFGYVATWMGRDADAAETLGLLLIKKAAAARAANPS